MATFILIVLLLVVVAALLWLGYLFACERLSTEQEKLDAKRQVFAAEWAALENARRVNDVFFAAREAMRRGSEDGR